MSSVVDFRFESVPLKAGGILTKVAPVLDSVGLHMASFCHELRLSDSGDVDESLVRIDVNNMEEAEHVGYGWAGRVHEYRWPVDGQDVDISAYAWHADLGCFVLAMYRSEWRWIAAERDRIIRCGGLMCLASATIGSSFGFMDIDSEYHPVREIDYNNIMSSLKSGVLRWPMFWVAEERLSHEELSSLSNERYSVLYFTSGYSLAFNEDELVKMAR